MLKDAVNIDDLLNITPYGVFIIDLSGKIIFASKMAAKRLNKSTKEMIGTTLADYFPIDISEKRRLKGIEAINSGISQSIEDKVGDRWYFSKIIPLKDRSEKITSLAIFSDDITERKLAEEALRKSEERFSLAMEASKDGIWDWDLTTGDIYCSPSLTFMLGYDSTDVIKNVDGWQDLIHPQDRQKAYQVNIDCVNNITDSFEIEYRMKTIDGGWKWISGRGRAVYRDDTGRALRMTGTHQDITERKRTEEALQKSEEQFRNLYDNAPVAYFEYDLRGNITRVNLTHSKLLGYTAEEMIGQPCWKFIVDEVAREQILDKLRGARPPAVGLERIYRRKDGTTFPVLFEDRLLTNEDGHITGIRTAIQDITDRKRMEEALIESESLFRVMFKDHSAVMLLIDPDTGQIIKANEAAVQYYGYPPEKMCQMKIQQLNILSPAQVAEQRLCALNKQINIFEFQHMLADGQVRDVEVHSAPITILHQTLLFSIIRDITERKQAEKALRESAVRLRQAQQMAKLGHWDWEMPNGELSWSDEVYAIFGRDKYNFQPSTEFFESCLHPDDYQDFLNERETAIAENRPVDIEHRIKLPDGTIRYVQELAEILKDNDGNIVRVSGTVQDITERKRGENYRKMEREVLQILNEPGDLKESIQRALSALKTGTGVDAAGFRLQEGEDFPYFVQDGFSKDFLLTENTLLERGKDGGVCRDKVGNVRLECTCGLVISGRTDPSNPLFTQGGSCWTNDSVPLLDLPSDQDPRLHPRNNCIHRGYASVALIPVRIQGQIYSRETCVRHGFSSIAQVPVRTSDRIVGLIQLNDKRKDRFNLEMIEILESIAAHVGSSLIRKQAEEELKASEQRARLQRSVLADLALNHAFAKGEVSDVLRLITRNLTQTLAVSRASIWVLSEDNLKLSCLMLYESDKDVFSSGTELQASGMPRYFKAIMQENRIYAEDAQNDPHTNELTDAYLKPLGITSMLDGGIIIEGRVKGVVCTEHIGPVRKWFPDEEAFISTISALVAQLMTSTERKRAEEALRESEQRYRTILDEMSEGYHEVDLAGNFTFFNEAFLNLFGYSRDEMLGTNFSRYAAEESIVKRVYQTYNEIYQTGNPVRRTEWDIIRKGGQKRTLEYSAAVVRDSENAPKGFRGIVRDITERKQAEAEREKLHAQLNQAQKMESVGRLAGGVAHDFNNMLGVILGHTELALLRTDDKHKLCSDLNEIQNAAKRSADITKQLLAFARKQTISPRQLDLNDTVESMLNMLGRLIGEDIDLVWKPSAHLWPVKMDPSQIDQILANLCVNARDAISGVGKLTIETGKKTFDEAYCNEHPGFIPGDFVLLAVSDNGCGMDKDTLENIFEPFFTTKEEDKGTGLGLATIYGIVKQNNGFINVYSEPGQGSTFKVYLPRLVTDEDTDMTVPEKKAAAGGIETILLVEDEPMILDMTTTMLEMLGYTVLAAASPDEAIQLAKDHTGKAHLLMSDVVLPEMNGRDLAAQIVHLYPDIRLLFMSGYTANVIAHQGILDDGVSFIQKPFSMADMTAKVREVLDKASDETQP
jgi:PAS domain S-box-containing protein